MKKDLYAPFPYFGGKRRIASIVWAALGQPKHYIEPFCGSCAVLLLRPGYDPQEHIETVNDADGHIANVWRSLQFSPDQVAKWCDWPVNHADLISRKKTLNMNTERLLENLCQDDKWHDPVMAGYYIWAASCWIGNGLICQNQVPYIASGGMGVHARGKRPHITTGGNGVHATGKIPRIGHGGEGIHAIGPRPHVSTVGVSTYAFEETEHVGDENIDVRAAYNTNIYKWFRQLSERLRYVRVVCGDWTRVCGGNWQDGKGVCGIFFDPPYSNAIGRRKDLYSTESGCSKDVAKWACERGKRKTYRIVLAGYEGEHDWLEKEGWRVYKWSAHGGYAHLGNGSGLANRHRERLWFSPHCLETEHVTYKATLF